MTEAPPVWGLFVDLQSLFYGVRDRYGRTARIDFKMIPDLVQTALGIDAFSCKIIVALRRGRQWDDFLKTLQWFGYEVVEAEDGLKDATLAIQVHQSFRSLALTGAVLVTGDERMGLLLDGGDDNGVVIATFPDIAQKIEGSSNVIAITKNWLWEGRS